MSTAFDKSLIVIPALNEQETIASVIAQVIAELPGATCLVVNDGSTDKTSSIARSTGAGVADLPYNLGVGGAMRLGFRFAAKFGYTSVVQVDADGQHDPADARNLIEALSDSDLVLGSRFIGSVSYEVKGPRRWAMILLAALISRAAGTKITDTTSGFRASGPKAINLFAEFYPAEYLGDTVESLVIATRAKLRIKELPVDMRERAGGTASHSPIKATVFLARLALAVLFALIRPKISHGRWNED